MAFRGTDAFIKTQPGVEQSGKRQRKISHLHPPCRAVSSDVVLEKNSRDEEGNAEKVEGYSRNLMEHFEHELIVCNER